MKKKLAICLSFMFLISCYPKGLQESIKSLPQKRLILSIPGNYRDVKGAIHVHSYLSHDSKGRPEEIINAAEKAGINFIIMTDHTNSRIFEEGMKGWYGNVLVIQGMEIVREKIALLGIGMKEYVNPRSLPLQEVINKIKGQNALVFAAHPRTYPEGVNFEGLNGIEIYNISDDAKDRKLRFLRYLFDIFFVYDRYPDEAFLDILDRPDKELAVWDLMTQKQKIVGIAGNNAHQNINIFGRQLDPYSRTLRFVNTHLFVQELNEDEILKTLSLGRAYISFDILADSAGFFFGAWDQTNSKFWAMGEEVSFKEGLIIRCRVPLKAKINLIKNGSLIYQTQGTTMEFHPNEKGVYRVELYLKIGRQWWPWIFSNPIYIL